MPSPEFYTSTIACAPASSDVMAAGNLHSRIVFWLKLALPLAALALLSTLFLFASNDGPPPEIPFAELNQIAREQRIAAPRLSGVADDGSVIVIAAEAARPDGSTLVIEDPKLTLNASDGTALSIRAGQGEIDNDTQTARLTGLARLETSTGYQMETTGLTADLETGVIQSLGPLEVQSPFGSLTAGAVTILASPVGDGQQMEFTGGVKLIYTPPEVAE